MECAATMPRWQRSETMSAEGGACLAACLKMIPNGKGRGRTAASLSYLTATL